MRANILILVLGLISHSFALLNLNLGGKATVNQFTSFSQYNGKQYHSFEESKYRQTVFNANLNMINLMNGAVNNTYKQGLTYYSDLTAEEFSSLVLNPRIATTPEARKEFQNLLTGLAGVTGAVISTVTGVTGALGGLLGLVPVINPVNGLLGGVSKGLGGLLVGLGGGAKNTKTTVNTNNNKNIVANQNIPANNKNQNQNQNQNQKIVTNTNTTSDKAMLPPINNNTNSVSPPFTPSKDIKASVDWRSSKFVSDVKMQGVCGNCYAFSATGALESAYMIKHNIIGVSYSDQQLTDCCGSKGFGCNGCEGGWQWQAFQYVKANGIATQKQYPTTSSEEGIVGNCQKVLSPFKIINQKTPFKALPQGNVTALYQAVSKQPVSVGVDSANMQFAITNSPNQLFTNCSSSFDDANHAMLIVGYDSAGNWILKNSWSNNWGNNGYIKLKAGNTCGVANYALYPIVN